MAGIGSLLVKLKGINITCCFNNLGFFGWKEMFVNWSTAFPLIRNMIDQAIIELGVNCFRTIGAPDAVLGTSPPLTLATYLARYSELISYVESKGCYFEATGGGWQNCQQLAGVDFSDSDILSYLISFAQMANAHPGVVGIDLIQEVNGWGKATSPSRTEDQNVAFISGAIAAIKSAGVTKPLTFSLQPWGLYTTLWDLPIVAKMAPYVDYLNFHVYYYPFSTADMAPALVYGKPIYIGECGVAKSGALSYGGNRVNFINELAVAITDPNLIGVCFWCLNEDATEADNFPWGLYDNIGNPYDLTAIAAFANIPLGVPVSTSSGSIPAFMFF